MPRPKRTDGLPSAVRRVLMSELNKTQHDQIQLLKSIDAKLTVLISKVHNQMVDMEAASKTGRLLLATLGDLLTADASTATEAEAVVRDFLFQVTKKKK